MLLIEYCRNSGERRNPLWLNRPRAHLQPDYGCERHAIGQLRQIRPLRFIELNKLPVLTLRQKLPAWKKKLPACKMKSKKPKANSRMPRSLIARLRPLLNKSVSAWPISLARWRC